MTRLLTLVFLLVVSMIVPATAFSQTRSCATDELHQQQMQEDPDYARSYLKRQEKFRTRLNQQSGASRAELCPDPVIVPMAVHYDGVAANADLQCLTDLALNQIQILNDDYQGLNVEIIPNWINNASSNYPGVDYAESCIEFCLATFDHPSGYGLVEGEPAITINEITGANSDWAGYINIFVRNIGALGFSPLGGNGNGDGVTVDNNAFGTLPGCSGFVPLSNFALGRTLTHELGHYLNLNHIWGGGCSVDDGVADTPDQSTSNGGCPSPTASSCGSIDLHMNYMDYTNDPCMYMFSAGQQARMETYLAANLGNVTNNTAKCAPPAPVIAFATSSSLEDEGSSSCLTAGTRQIPVEITIDAPPSATATLFMSATGSATQGIDYTINPSVVNFSAGQANSQIVTITLLEDAYVEGDESIVLSYTLNANGGNAEAGTSNQIHTITIRNDDFAPQPGTQTVLLVDNDFNAGLSNFTIVNGGSNAETWKLAAGGNNLDGTQFIISDSDAAGNGSTTNESLYTPVFDGTSVDQLTLSFDQYIRVYAAAGDYNETFQVQIFNGSTWVTVYNRTEAQGSLGNWGNPNTQSINLSSHAATDNQIRFVHDARWDWWWALDNVEVSGEATTQIGIEANVGSNGGAMERDFGPFSTVHFRDENSGAVMLSLTNLTGHDYGCTTVAIDRGSSASTPGATASTAPQSAWLTDKTYLVNPEINNPNGTYSITLYYTAAEIAGWAAESGESPATLQMVKAAGAIASATNLEVFSTQAGSFGSDFTYTSTVNTGFSGFALGGQAVLPVEWLGLNAKANEASIDVNWSTATESGNRYFEILRKAENDRTFTSIGQLAGAGDSRTEKSYVWQDGKALPGVNYTYQIRQVDFDGSNSLSPIATARIAVEGLVVKAFPNPASDLLNIHLFAPNAGSYRLVNINGSLVYTGDFAAGSSALTVPTANLPAGVYSLLIATQRGRVVKRIVVE